VNTDLSTGAMANGHSANGTFGLVESPIGRQLAS
jgi:hypothetical protein